VASAHAEEERPAVANAATIIEPLNSLRDRIIVNSPSDLARPRSANRRAP
jgi:hypothetical protein